MTPPRKPGFPPLWRVAGYAMLIAIAFLCAVPLIWMVLTSLRPGNTVFGGPIIPKRFTLSSYAFVWTKLDILHFFLNSVYITGVTLVIVLAASTLAGYGFARLRFRGSGVVFGALLSTLFLPSAAILIPVFVELKFFHLIGSQMGLILLYSGTNVAFAVLLMRVFFERLPRELVDAARIDGAGDLRIFWRVMLPLAGPGVVTVSIIQVLTTWNELLFANSLIQQPNLLPIQPELYTLVGQYTTNWPAVTAAFTIASIPMIVIYIVLQRRFIAGLTAGALNG
ncbi:MAG TPA: carbohydrate ABC transporter permease [Streptosporangiaceae bacterium]|nr:carbohydrate ABC transporter permease [Streptosporangiaceae bacterium]